MKKCMQTSLLVFVSLLLLTCAAATASAQEGVIRGSIRWRKEMGLIPMGPGNKQAAPRPCGQFSVAAEDPQNGFKAVAYTSGMGDMVESGDYYVCPYSFRVPLNKSLYIVATMGGVLLLPKEDRSPMYITDAWIGGSNSKPPRGYERSFTGFRYVTVRGSGRPGSPVGGIGSRRGTVVTFEMTYLNDNPR